MEFQIVAHLLEYRGKLTGLALATLKIVGLIVTQIRILF